jgi:hypothetical protein
LSPHLAHAPGFRAIVRNHRFAVSGERRFDFFTAALYFRFFFLD